MDWLQTLLTPLTRVVNGILATDDGSRARLEGMAGKRLAVVLEGTGVEVALLFEADAVRLDRWDSSEQPATAVVRGSPAALLALARDPLGGGDRVSFSGDLGFVRDVRRLLADLDLDLEEQLSGIVGDDLAHHLGATGRRLQRWLEDARRAVASGVAEYLTEERRLLPSEAEAEIFLSAVDDLREDADRLEARLRRLERRLGQRRNRT